MKVKITKCAVFSLLTAGIFLFLNYRYMNSAYYRSIESIAEYENIPANLQIVNFGSSHGKNSFDYSVLPEYRCFNFAFGSQRPFFDRYMFETYNKYFGDGCVVLIPISYFSLYSDPMGRYAEMLPRYSRILDTSKLPGISFKDLLLYKYFPILTSKRNIRAAFVYVPPTGETKTVITDWEQAGLERAGSYYREHMEQIIEPLQLDAINAMCEQSLKNGWKPVLVTTPFTVYYNNGFTPEFIEKFRAQVNEIAANYNGVIYLDYSDDERFRENTELFTDTDHLNKQGRGIFTQILYDDIKKAGLL